MTFSLNPGGVVMSSQLKPTQSSNTHPVANMSPIYSVSHPNSGDNPPERGRTVQKNAWPSKNGRVKLDHIHMHQGSSLLPVFLAASILIPPLPKATFTPSIQTNLGLPRPRPLRAPTINTILVIRYSSIHSTCPTISILSYPFYSLTPFLYQLSFLTLSIRDTSTNLLKHFISRTCTCLH